MSKSLTANFTAEKNKSSGAAPRTLLETITDTTTLKYSDQALTIDISNNTPWCGNEADKLYLQSGQFTSTVKTSEDITTIDNFPQGISYDGTDTLWCGNQADKLYLQSGQFTSTLKDSESVGATDTNPTGISWDGTNTPWCGSTDNKLYLQSGQFASILKTSEDVNAVDVNPTGISWDGTNTPWSGLAGIKLYLQSGQFTSTLKDSEFVFSVDTNPRGISWDGTNTPWCGAAADKLYLQSGQFTSTVKTSEDVSVVDTSVQGIETNKIDSRLDIASYTANVLAWPNRIKSQVVPGEEVVRTSDMNITLNNNPRIDASIRPGLIVSLYMWFNGLADADKLLWFKGIINDNINYDIYKLDFTAMDIGNWFNKQIGIPLDTATYPNADPDHIGRVQPIGYGDIKNHSCLAIVAGAVSTLVNDISIGASSIELSDASAFPSSGTLIIGAEEDITWSGRSANTLTGVANVSFAYPRSTRVMEKIANLKYMAFGHVVKALTNPRILPYGMKLEDAVRIDTGDFSVNLDDSGIATVTLTNIANIQKSVIIAVTQQQTQEADPDPHLHTTTSVSLIERHPSGTSNPDNFGNPTNAHDFDEDTYANKIGTGSPIVNNLTFTGFSTTNLGTIQEVRIAVRSHNIDGDFIKIFANWQGGGTYSNNWVLGNSLATRKLVTTISSWSEIGQALFEASVELGEEARVHEVWYEIDYIPAIDTTQINIDEVLPTIVGGNSVADTLGGDLIIDAEGHLDDNPAHYTDVADSLIEEPWDVIHHILENYSNGVTDADIDLAGSFQDAEDNLPASYEFAFVITQKIKMNRLLAMLAQQTWCRFIWEAGTAKLNWIKDSGASSKSINTNTDSYVSKDNRHLVKVRQRGLNEIFNDIEVKYNLNPTLGGWNNPDAYKGSSEATDSNSITNYKTRQRTWLMFAIGNNSSMADDIRDKLKDFYKANRKEVTFPSWLKHAEIERGDLIELTTTQLGFGSRLHEVIEVDFSPPVPINKQRPEIVFKLLDLMVMLETLSFTITSTVSVLDGVHFHTPWTGFGDDKLYLQSGQFTSTLKDSEYIGGTDTDPQGISWDGTNTPWCGSQGPQPKLFLTSGQFTSTLKDSEGVVIINTDPSGISWDGTNSPWCGNGPDKLYLQSGQFTSTIKTSEDVSVVDNFVFGISWDGTNTPWCGFGGGKLYLTSGQFTSTVKDSESIVAIDGTPTGISYDGTNTPWTGVNDDKLYLQSGQFTSTLKDSEYIGGTDTDPTGIGTNDVFGRLKIRIELLPFTITSTVSVIDLPVYAEVLSFTITSTVSVEDSSHFSTLWCGNQTNKLYLTSGQFTSTIKDSESVGATDTTPQGISYDGTNTPWCGDEADKLYLQSGQFTSTVKASESVNVIDTSVWGISWDGTNTPWCGNEADKLYLQSGQFTSTVKASEDISAVDVAPTGISWDGTNTPWCGNQTNKLYLQSGQFTSTLKDSESIGVVDTAPTGISWDGTNTPWCGTAADKLYLQSGQFTSTIKTSEDVGGVDLIPTGIDTNNVVGRIVGDTPWCGTAADKLYLQSGQFTSTIKASESVNVIGTNPQDISYDGTDTPWIGAATNKLYLQSGQFTSTLKTSEGVSVVDTQGTGISWDGTNTPWAGIIGQKLYLQSGQFTSTIKDSEDISAVNVSPTGISWDGTNTPWAGNDAGGIVDKLYLTSGQFTSTIKASEDVNVIDANPTGISWDGVDTLWIGTAADRLYLQSGQFTSTLKTSEYIGGVDNVPTGIDTNHLNGRLGI